jgi:hypothetical protein
VLNPILESKLLLVIHSRLSTCCHWSNPRLGPVGHIWVQSLVPGKVVGGKFIVKRLFGKDLEEKLFEFTVRIKVIDKGVEPALATYFLDSNEWKAFRGYFVNATIGEVLNNAGKLLG